VAEGHRAATPQAPLTRPGVGRMLLRRVGGSEVSGLVMVGQRLLPGFPAGVVGERRGCA
jgi:hypothetical protein